MTLTVSGIESSRSSYDYSSRALRLCVLRLPPAQYVESSQVGPDAPSPPSTGLTSIRHALPLSDPYSGMNHYEQAHGILAEHVRQYVESYASAHTASRKEFAHGC
jgi:hypothetical protein